MRLLAVESATRTASVALLDGEGVLAECADDSGRHHAEVLLPLIERVLARASTPADALSGFAVSIGPGSFTSLRVGLATVKGLAMPEDLPVAPIPTLRALAWQWGGDRPDVPVAAVLDARRGELYAAVVGRDAQPLVDEGLYARASLRARLPRECAIVGEPAALLAGEEAPPGWRLEPSGLRAVTVGRLGLRAFAEGRTAPASSLVPRYVRRAEAEAKRLGQATEPGPTLDTPRNLS